MRLPIPLPSVSLRENAFIYIVKLLTGSLIVWYGLRAVGIPEPIWAMISLIVVTEPDLGLAKTQLPRARDQYDQRHHRRRPGAVDFRRNVSRRCWRR